MIRIILADDHALVREGLVSFLHRQPDMKVVAQAATGHETINAVQHTKADILVLDISMPQKNGLDVITEMKQSGHTMPVLLLTMHPEDRYALRALKGGAMGYLTKESAPKELVNAIRMVASGRRYISPRLADRLASAVENGRTAPIHETLSDREFQIFTLLASGKSVSEIADELYLAPGTIYTHRKRILEKMNMKSDIQLTHYALEQNLI